MLDVWIAAMHATDAPLTPNSTIADLVAAFPAAARILVGHRMHCVGCDVAAFETIADACAIYGVAVEDVIAEVQRAMAEERTTDDHND